MYEPDRITLPHRTHTLSGKHSSISQETRCTRNIRLLGNYRFLFLAAIVEHAKAYKCHAAKIYPMWIYDQNANALRSTLLYFVDLCLVCTLYSVFVSDLCNVYKLFGVEVSVIFEVYSVLRSLISGGPFKMRFHSNIFEIFTY